MTQDNQLPLALVRAQMAFWTHAGELMQENRGRWLELAEHSLARDAGEAQAETTEALQATEWSQLSSLPMNTGWRLLNQSVGHTQDLALTAINNQTALAAGLQRALAEWQHDTASALTQTRNAMPFSGLLADMVGSVGVPPAEPVVKRAKK